jgi:hypothetical protein
MGGYELPKDLKIGGAAIRPAADFTFLHDPSAPIRMRSPLVIRRCKPEKSLLKL